MAATETPQDPAAAESVARLYRRGVLAFAAVHSLLRWLRAEVVFITTSPPGCKNGIVNTRFPAASWPASLKAVSTIATIVLFVVFYFGRRTLPNDPVGLVLKPVALFIPFVLLGVALLFIVSGYEVGRRELSIGRLLWSTVIPLQGLTRVWHDPEAMRKSLRVIGNGGMFAISGIFQSKTLGRYRAFVTDPESAVVLVLLNRTVVISPENPRAFVDYVRYLYPSVEGKPE